jgi:hypothetical protein
MSDENAGSREPGYGGGPVVLYAVALQQAKQSGDLTQMRRLAEQARSEGSNDPEIQSALKDLQAEIDRAGNG